MNEIIKNHHQKKKKKKKKKKNKKKKKKKKKKKSKYLWFKFHPDPKDTMPLLIMIPVLKMIVFVMIL